MVQRVPPPQLSVQGQVANQLVSRVICLAPPASSPFTTYQNILCD